MKYLSCKEYTRSKISKNVQKRVLTDVKIGNLLEQMYDSSKRISSAYTMISNARSFSKWRILMYKRTIKFETLICGDIFKNEDQRELCNLTISEVLILIKVLQIQ